MDNLYNLFIIHIPKSSYRDVGAHQRQRKGEEGKTMRRAKKRKEIKAQRVKPPIPSWVVDTLIGDEEQNGKWEKETESGSPTQLPWTIWSPPAMRRDHTVSLVK